MESRRRGPGRASSRACGPQGLRLLRGPGDARHSPRAPRRRPPPPGAPGAFLRSPEGGRGRCWAGGGTHAGWVPKASPRPGPAPARTGCAPRAAPRPGPGLPAAAPPQPGRAQAVRPPPRAEVAPLSRSGTGRVLPAGRGRAGRRADGSVRLSWAGRSGSPRRGGVTSRRVALATAAEEGQGAHQAPGAMEGAAAVPAASSGALVPAAAAGTAVVTGKEATPPAPRRPKKILDEEAYIEVGRRAGAGAWARAAPLSWHPGRAASSAAGPGPGPPAAAARCNPGGGWGLGPRQHWGHPSGSCGDGCRRYRWPSLGVKRPRAARPSRARCPAGPGRSGASRCPSAALQLSLSL